MRAALLATRLLATVLLATPATAETSAEAQARRPDAFDAFSGLRIAAIRAPTPSDLPGGAVVDAAGVAAARDAGALLLDVVRSGAGTLTHGVWRGAEPRATIPGAAWLPGLGQGAQDPDVADYVEAGLTALLGDDLDRPVVVFCVADCWASWNAGRRLVERGHATVLWHPSGVDGWAEAGRPFVHVLPVSVEGGVIAPDAVGGE